MSGLFNTLNTANKGLTAQELSLHTVGHNIANINTRGYSRQRVDLMSDRPYSYHGVGQVGTGVRMSGVSRSVSLHINRQTREELGNLAKLGSRSEALDQLEIIFNEPSKTGLNYNLGEMFLSWKQLGENPELESAKSVVVEKSKTLADTITDMANRINTVEEGIYKEIDGNIRGFNESLKQLEDLNKQIANFTLRGDQPNDLLDKRDQLIEDMGTIVNIDVEFDEYSRASVSIDGNTLLDIKDGKIDELSSSEGQVSLASSQEDIDIKSGSLKGHMEGLDDVANSMDELKNFTKIMAEAINIIHGGGVNKIDFFEFEDLGEGKGFSLKVNKELTDDPSKVNAGKDENSSSGDGSRAQAIAKLQDTKLGGNIDDIEYNEDTMTIKDVKDGKTIRGQYGSIVTDIGIAKKHSDDMIENQLLVTEQIIMKKDSISGVSMNEEITDMIKFQQAYNANAKVISVISEMLDTLIHGTGV